jgi:NAD dependent epimerase/dehydratase family enzyme
MSTAYPLVKQSEPAPEDGSKQSDYLNMSEPVTMKEFCKTLGEVLHRPSWLPVPEFTLRLAFGEPASLMTRGQRVIPTVALDGGYRFRYPDLQAALRSIVTTVTAPEVRS